MITLLSTAQRFIASSERCFSRAHARLWLPILAFLARKFGADILSLTFQDEEYRQLVLDNAGVISAYRFARYPEERQKLAKKVVRIMTRIQRGTPRPNTCRVRDGKFEVAYDPGIDAVMKDVLAVSEEVRQEMLRKVKAVPPGGFTNYIKRGGNR